MPCTERWAPTTFSSLLASSPKVFSSTSVPIIPNWFGTRLALGSGPFDLVLPPLNSSPQRLCAIRSPIFSWLRQKMKSSRNSSDNDRTLIRCGFSVAKLQHNSVLLSLLVFCNYFSVGNRFNIENNCEALNFTVQSLCVPFSLGEKDRMRGIENS